MTGLVVSAVRGVQQAVPVVKGLGYLLSCPFGISCDDATNGSSLVMRAMVVLRAPQPQQQVALSVRLLERHVAAAFREEKERSCMHACMHAALMHSDWLLENNVKNWKLEPAEPLHYLLVDSTTHS